MASAPVVVVGAGISGLACAHRLVELDADREVLVLEASGRVATSGASAPRTGS